MKISYFMLSIALLNSELLICEEKVVPSIKEPLMVFLEATKDLIVVGSHVYVERQKGQLNNTLKEAATNFADIMKIMRSIGCPNNLEYDSIGRISNVSNYRACIRLHNSLVNEGQRMQEAILTLEELKKISK